MRTLKTSLVISLAVLFLAACQAEVNVNTNHNANSNTASAPPVIPVTPTANANVNANTPAGTGSSSGAAANTNTATTTATSASTDAAALYSTVAKPSCGGCHGADGKGKPAFKDIPDFTNAAWQAKETDAELIETIKNGHKPMPAYKDKLSDDQIKALVAYVRQFAKR